MCNKTKNTGQQTEEQLEEKNRYPNTRLLLIQLNIPGCSLKLNNNELRIGCCPEAR